MILTAICPLGLLVAVKKAVMHMGSKYELYHWGCGSKKAVTSINVNHPNDWNDLTLVCPSSSSVYQWHLSWVHSAEVADIYVTEIKSTEPLTDERLHLMCPLLELLFLKAHNMRIVQTIMVFRFSTSWPIPFWYLHAIILIFPFSFLHLCFKLKLATSYTFTFHRLRDVTWLCEARGNQSLFFFFDISRFSYPNLKWANSLYCEPYFLWYTEVHASQWHNSRSLEPSMFYPSVTYFPLLVTIWTSHY